MGAGASSKGGGATARQKGGGGFSPQAPMPYQYSQTPMGQMSPYGGGIRALSMYGGKGGGGYGMQQPYQTPMQQMPTMYNQRIMPQAAAQQALDSGMQVGPTPGQVPSPLEGMDMAQRQAMNQQIQMAQMEAAQRARQEVQQSQAPQQAQAQAQMEAMRQRQIGLMPQPSRLPNQTAMRQALLAGAQRPPEPMTVRQPAQQPARQLRAQYMPVDQGDGTDQFGAQIQTEPMGRIAGGVDTDQLRDRMSSKGGARTSRQMPTPALSSTKGGARSAVQERNPRISGAGIASLASGKGGSRTMRQ